MTQPGGQKIGAAYVEISADINRDSISKAAAGINKDVEKGVNGATGALSTLQTSFTNTGNKAAGMTQDINRAVDKIDDSDIRNKGKSIDDLGDNMGNTASRSAQFAGGLGDLGGALGATNTPLAGLGKAMEAAGPAIMGVTGAADLAEGSMLLFKAAQESVWLGRIKDTAAMVAQKAAVIGGTIVTGIATAAQWAWNVAMNANPIGLIILAVVAFIAALGLLIKNWDKVKAATIAVWNAIKSATTATWNAIKDAIGAAWNWVKNTVVNVGSSIKGAFLAIWNFIKGNVIDPFKIGLKALGEAFMWVWNNVVKPYIGIWKTGFNLLWTGIKTVFGFINGAFNNFKTNAINAFTKAKDGIKTVWDKLKSIAATPINFLINSVYNNGIKKVWNSLAGKVGLGDLPDVAPLKFAKGGRVPGVGNGDTVPAMLTPGEGILTKKEMSKLGGPAGFQALRDQIQHFADGGIVGWLKDKVASPIRGGLYSLANSAADKFVRPAINSLPGSGMWMDGAKATGNTGIDKMLAWLKGDDKKHAGSSSLPGGSGYKNQIAQLAKAGFNLSFANSQLTGGGHSSTSNHYKGRAIDIGVGTNGLAQVENVWKYLVENFAKSSKELYWAAKPTNYRNGNEIGPTDKTDHIHWAMDRAGVVPAGSTVGITNATSKDEYMMTAEHMRTIMGPLVGDTNYNVTVNLDPAKFKDVQDMLDAIQALGMKATTKKVLN